MATALRALAFDDDYCSLARKLLQAYDRDDTVKDIVTMDGIWQALTVSVRFAILAEVFFEFTKEARQFLFSAKTLHTIVEVVGVVDGRRLVDDVRKTSEKKC